MSLVALSRFERLLDQAAPTLLLFLGFASAAALAFLNG